MDWQSKLEHVLEEKCNENLEKILNYLEKQENQETKFGLVTHPVFTKWIQKVVVTWNTNQNQSSTKTISLVLGLASFLTKKEENFCSLSISFPTKLILKAKETLGNSGVTLAYIRLLSSFLDHKSGIEWMMVCNFWEDVHNFAISKDTGEIIDESTIFLSKLLEKSINYDDKFADKVVKKLMSPLGDNVHRRLKAPDVDTQNRIASKYIKPTLRLIERILLHFMDGIYLKKKDFTVAVIFLKNFHLEERISDFMIIAQLKSLVFEISKIMFIMQFLELYVKTLRNKIIAADINSTIERIKNNSVGTVAKKDFEDVPLDLARFSVLYWNLVQSTIPLQQDKLTLADEFSKMFVLPSVALVFKNCYSNFSELDKMWLKDDIRSLFIQKMVKTVDHETFRIFIRWRDKLMSNPKLFYLGTQYLIQLKETIKYLNTEQAIRIFQALQYVLKDLGRVIKEQAEEYEHFFRETQYFALVFEVIRLLVEKFHIKWNDSYETLEVMGICFDYLMLPEWQSPVVVQILKLVGTTIVKNMSPNLALLVDDNTDSSIALLGPLLYRKMLDEEVKMAALELVHTVTKISNKKFPSLQKVLLDSELPSLVLKIGTSHREEKPVQAMAIKCLREMIQVEDIWNEALKTQNLLEKMCGILLHNSERSICVEVASLISVAYQHQQLPQNLDNIYETMIDASTNNLYWDVRVCGLKFWDRVISTHLQNQGMIDDYFPEVTFSKEHRKIVTLTNSEIRRRLLKVLSELSTIGCLGVLVHAIKDDCDKEVCKVAVDITERLVILFERYHLKDDGGGPLSPQSVSSGVSVGSPGSGAIDEIVNNEAERMLSAYCSSDYGSVRSDDLHPQTKNVVSPNEFLQFCQEDFNSFISEKKNWLHGIEELELVLDTMLRGVKK